MVIAIIGIVTTVAYPMYQEHVFKIKRAEAKSALVQLKMRMDSHLLYRNSYLGAHIDGTDDNDMIWPTSLTETGLYKLEISTLTATNYTIQAIPQGPQANDLTCGSLQITNTNTKGITGTGITAECWY